jgi:hypothetical protein
MTELKVKRLDSPLNRDTRSTSPVAPDSASAVPAQTGKRRRRSESRPGRRLAEAPAPAGPEASPRSGLADPPRLDEPLELLSSRLPASLRRSLTELTTALRTRDGERLSQKSLPEQEVLAALIWAAGTAGDPDAVARLGATLREFRARRYAAAAAALRS